MHDYSLPDYVFLNITVYLTILQSYTKAERRKSSLIQSDFITLEVQIPPGLVIVVIEFNNKKGLPLNKLDQKTSFLEAHYRLRQVEPAVKK